MSLRPKLLAAAIAVGALAGAAASTTAAPLGTEGCRVPAAERVVGAITHERWPLEQRRPDGSEIRRTYTVHVPPQHREQQLPPLPLVLDLHGHFSSGFQQNLDSRMSVKGREKGFIVAQPDSWPWWATSLLFEALRGGVNDIEYIARLLDLFDQKLCFDRNRIFVIGGKFFGAAMAPVLACASTNGELRQHRIAAIAMVTSLPVPTFHAPPWEKRPGPADALGWVPWISKKWIRICPQLSRDPIPLLVIFSSNDLTLGPGSAALPRRPWPTKASPSRGSMRKSCGRWSRTR